MGDLVFLKPQSEPKAKPKSRDEAIRALHRWLHASNIDHWVDVLRGGLALTIAIPHGHDKQGELITMIEGLDPKAIVGDTISRIRVSLHNGLVAKGATYDSYEVLGLDD